MRALCLLLMMAAAGLAAEVKVAPEIKVKVGRLAKITATSDSPAVIRYLNVHEDMDLIESETGRYATVLPVKAGRFKVGLYSDAGGPPAYCVIIAEGDTPKPPPVPDPPVPNPPPPDPKPPIPTGGPFWIVVVEETQDAVATRGAYFRSPGLAAKMKLKGHKLRLTDKDVKDRDGNTPVDLKPYIDRAAGKTLPQLYIVNKNGDVPYEGPLPTESAGLIALLDKLEGGK